MIKERLSLDIMVGTNIENEESVIIKGADRRSHTLINASNRSGREEAFILPMIQQDLKKVANYTLKQTPVLTYDEDELYLNGITIIESTNELCQESWKLANKYGIPDKAITYINPLDPNTPSINPMRGEVDKVVRVLTQIVEDYYGVSDNANILVQRDHLKHYIYLLKLHDKNKDVTLDMLLDMYNNPRVVRTMHESLKTMIPERIDRIEDREKRNYWKIVKGVDYWFNSNLVLKKNKSGMVSFVQYDESGLEVYEDVKAEQISGLKTILNDIGTNQKLRRVLFGTTDFDFDKHLKSGGILLINTAKHELGELSGVLGKIVLMNLQNSTFNRELNSPTYHHIIVDELPKYIYPSFLDFPVAAGKLNVFLTVLQQTDVKRFGQDYQDMLNTNLRNRITHDSVFDVWKADIIVNNKSLRIAHLKPDFFETVYSHS